MVPYIKKIKEKLAKLKASGASTKWVDIRAYTLFAKYDLSFECSPDNYFEIYGTQEALALFFLPRSNKESLSPHDEELVGFEMLRDYCDDRFVHIVDHFYPDSDQEYSTAIYAHHFGSEKNHIERNISLMFSYLMEQYLICEQVPADITKQSPDGTPRDPSGSGGSGGGNLS